MALLWLESFDYLDSADLSLKYALRDGATIIDTTVKKNGRASVRINNDYDALVWSKTLQVDGSVFTTPFIIIGCSFRIDRETVNTRIFELASSGGTGQLSLYYDGPSRRLQVKRFTTLIATGTNEILQNSWYYIEWKVKISNSSGANECIVKVDNVTDIDVGAGADLQNHSTDELDRVFLSNANSFAYYDNWYICDTTGTKNNDFLGPIVVESILPNGNGTTNQFTGQDADSTDNYLNVDENTFPDNDTSYNESDTVSNVDLYALANLTGNVGTIHGIQLISKVRKSDTSNPRGLKNLVRSGTTNYEGSELTLTDSYAYKTDRWENDPDTAVAWTESGVNAIEAGVKVES